MKSRFKIQSKIPKNSFITLYFAYDYILCEQVTLKIETTSTKNPKIIQEYTFLQKLHHIPSTPKIYNYFSNFTDPEISNNPFECIEMEFLDINIINFIKNFDYYNTILAYDILIKALISIEQIHNMGYILNNIELSNFYLRKKDKENIIKNYSNGILFNNFDLILINYENIEIKNNNNKNSIKNDLFSFFIMILDLLNEQIPWRESEEKNIKDKCINSPEKYLLLTTTKNKKEILNILNYIKNIENNICDYKYIYEQLYSLRNKEINIFYYKNEINKQITHLQNNLLPNINNNNYYITEKNETENKIKKNIIFNYSDSFYKSIPSLNSTYHNTISILQNNKNYIKQESFYDSVLKGNNNEKNFINHNELNNDYIINFHKKYYTPNKKEIIQESDKSLIMSLIKYNSETPKKKKRKRKNKEGILRYNIHQKRKNIIFNIVKKIK